MAFNTGGNGGISEASDVALSAVSDDQVLTFDGEAAKWTNKNSTAGFIDGIITEGDTPPAPGIYIVRPE